MKNLAKQLGQALTSISGERRKREKGKINPSAKGGRPLDATTVLQPNMERVRLGREAAVVKWEPERSRAEVTLMLDGRIMMQIKGDNIDSQEVAVDLMRDWDLDAVREQSAR